MRFNRQNMETTADTDWLATMELASEPRSLITGQESLAELRTKIIELSQAGPARQTQLHGPFHIMGSLSRDSLTTLVNSLSREACLDLFEMEQNCWLPSGAPGPIKSYSRTHGGTLCESRSQ